MSILLQSSCFIFKHTINFIIYIFFLGGGEYISTVVKHMVYEILVVDMVFCDIQV